jgi:hypothetical protein
VRVDVDVSDDLRVGAGGDVVERILAPLVENGCRYARSQVRIAAESRPGAIDDDRPGDVHAVSVAEGGRFLAHLPRG